MSGGIRRWLDEEVDPALVHRLWRGARARHERGERRRLVARVAAWSVVAITLVSVGLSPLWLERVVSSDGPLQHGYLTLRDGRIPQASRGGNVSFADGSTIRVSGDTRWTPLRNNEKVFDSEMTPGMAFFDITPGGPRRWSIRAGSTIISVLGTRFEVKYSLHRTEVRVERGVVRVADPQLAGGERLLRAGEQVRIEVDEGPAAPSPVDSPQGLAVGTDESRPRPPDRREGEGSDGRADRGQTSPGVDAERGGDLLRRADRERLAGDPRAAVVSLERFLAEYPERPEAAVAAVMLGRIEMDQLDRPERARRAFARARELGIPPPLRAGVERRLRALR